jgi:hypothetical protein
VPKTANGPEGTVDFESVKVEEHFTIYLHNETTGQNIKQWEWSYAYKVDSQRQLIDVSSLEPSEVPVSGDLVVNQPVTGEANTRHLDGWFEP